ncbi:MAG: hypothetical protein Q7R41_03640 [Phycisphaerales bacterium]|nr:hypothetical protein [Phycisphaerales bacterium]
MELSVVVLRGRGAAGPIAQRGHIANCIAAIQAIAADVDLLTSPALDG